MSLRVVLPRKEPRARGSPELAGDSRDSAAGMAPVRPSLNAVAVGGVIANCRDGPHQGRERGDMDEIQSADNPEANVAADASMVNDLQRLYRKSAL